MIKPPLYSSNKIDSDEIIIGYLKNPDNIMTIRDDNVLVEVGIDRTNLSISFDNGKSFIKLSDLEVHTCTDFKLEYTNMKMNKRKDVQPPNGSIFTIITDKGR